MLLVFHGDDDYSLRLALDEMKAGLGDATTADLNTSVLDGRSVSFDDLRTTCDTMPFLANKRLVIVEGLLARYEPRSTPTANDRPRGDPLESALRAYLPTLPGTADLVFVEREPITERNPLLKLIKEAGGRVRVFTSPTGPALSKWISEHVQAAGGTISPRAVETLAAFVGSNLRQLAQEIDKLVAYAGGRQIQEGDVHLLVADAREIKVWALTDALATRQRPAAVNALHHMLEEGQQAPMIMALITRQFRMLLQVKELLDARLSSDAIAAKLNIHPYRAQRAAEAARGFSYARLDAIYHALLDTDVAVKTGRLAPDVALDMLVLELTE